MARRLPVGNCLTLTGAGILREIKCQVLVTTPTFGVTQIQGATTAGPFDGIWDTGATNSVITQKVIDDLGIQPIGMIQVHGVSGQHVSEVYLVDIRLPMNTIVSAIRVSKGQLPPGTDVLIGMDVITRGDFAITHKTGVTKMSFRVPSQSDIDYVAEHNRQAAIATAPGRAQAPGTPPGKRRRRR